MTEIPPDPCGGKRSVIVEDILFGVKEQNEGRSHTGLTIFLHQTQNDGNRHVQENPDRVHGMQQRLAHPDFPDRNNCGTLVSGEPTDLNCPRLSSCSKI